MTMRITILFALLLGAFSVHAQNTIYCLAIGNWRNGPTVYLSPLIETTEAMTKPALRAQLRAQYAELKDIADDNFDVLLFGTKEEGEDKRVALQRSYMHREMPVVMLGGSVTEGTSQPK